VPKLAIIGLRGEIARWTYLSRHSEDLAVVEHLLAAVTALAVLAVTAVAASAASARSGSRHPCMNGGSGRWREHGARVVWSLGSGVGKFKNLEKVCDELERS